MAIKKTVIVLSGKQGIGKTMLLQSLGVKDHQIEDLSNEYLKDKNIVFVTSHWMNKDFIFNDLDENVSLEKGMSFCVKTLNHKTYDELMNDKELKKELLELINHFNNN